MSGNRRRHANVVPLASILMWILVCAFVGAAGLGYVSLKNQLHTGADEIKKLERGIEQISTRITVVKGEINRLSSMESLAKRYESDKAHLGGLVEISPGAIVWVDRPLLTVTDADDLQQAAHTTSR
jgi:cell division protein FtsB